MNCSDIGKLFAVIWKFSTQFCKKFFRERFTLIPSFQIFDGKIDILSQVRLFSTARMIFGIHGAGLSNLIFSPPTCITVEIPIHNNTNPLFQEISAMMNRNHHTCGISCDYQGTITIDNKVIETIQNDVNTAKDIDKTT